MKNKFAEYLNLKIAPKSVLISLFFLLFLINTYAQDSPPNGTGNFSHLLINGAKQMGSESGALHIDVSKSNYDPGWFGYRFVKNGQDYDIEVSVCAVNLNTFTFNNDGKEQRGDFNQIAPNHPYQLDNVVIEISCQETGLYRKYTFSINGVWGKRNNAAFRALAFSESEKYIPPENNPTGMIFQPWYCIKVNIVNEGSLSPSSFPSTALKQYIQDQNTINENSNNYATNSQKENTQTHNNSSLNYSTNQNNATNSSNNNNNTTTQQTTQIDEWGNPVNTQTNTVKYGGTEIQNNEHYQSQMSLRSANQDSRENWERNEAAKKQRVDDNNNNVMNEAYQLNLKTTNEINDMNNAFSELGNLAGTGNLSNPESLINAGLGIIRTANTIKGVRMGATLGGIGIAMGIIGQFSGDKKAEEEARRRQKEAEAKANAALEAMANARLSLFESFPPGELPLSFTKSKDNNLYYFVYAYNEDSLRDIETKISVSNVFALGRYPDGTWPMKNKVEDEVAALTTSREIICGPFYTINEANDVRTEFIVNLEKVYLKSEPIEYQGINAHSEDKINGTQNSNLDFWGNPLNEKTNLENPSSVPVDKQSNQKLDFFGNPIND